jgi:GTP-binding protein
MSAAEIKEQLARLKRSAKTTPLLVSAVSRKGVPDALRALLRVIDEKRTNAAAETTPHDDAWHP